VESRIPLTCQGLGESIAQIISHLLEPGIRLASKLPERKVIFLMVTPSIPSELGPQPMDLQLMNLRPSDVLRPLPIRQKYVVLQRNHPARRTLVITLMNFSLGAAITLLMIHTSTVCPRPM